jgi:hypothetical protein
MKLKTNIYHVTADNGQQYEDYTSFSVTIHAQNEEQAIRKGLDKISKDFFIDREALTNGSAELIFADAEIEVPTPEPLKATISEIDFNFYFDTNCLFIGIGSKGYTFNAGEIRAIHNYLTNIVGNLK